MLTAQNLNPTQELAGELLEIIGRQTDYRQRVDAISMALRGHEELTARTALMVALASVSPQPAQNWLSGR